MTKSLMNKETVIRQIKIKNHWLLNPADEYKTFEDRLNDLLSFEEWAVSENILTWNEVEAAEFASA